MECFLIDSECYGREARNLKELCTYNRINALAAIYRAQHGWLGASFSVAEILTALYFDAPQDDDTVLLSKGHAAAMQYAALAGRGFFPVSDLLKYKCPDGPQAHTDMSTPGIAINSGSLGQALSKGCGMAMAGPGHVFIILGDGELQEGQNYEALMTLAHYELPNVTVIVDCNGIQSDSNVDAIMGIGDPAAVLRGFGLTVCSVAGNDMAAVCACLSEARKTERPSAILAHTKKGAGVSFMAANDTARRAYVWHGKAPSQQDYMAALAELAGRVVNEELAAKLLNFARDQRPASPVVASSEAKTISTGTAFAAGLLTEARQNKRLYVLDADLEKPCRLTDFAATFPERFLEMGISEQDMVSCAGGLALRGMLPVVNTYAAFYRRAYEQVYVNATEQTKVVYAGHYAGLCYTTDGKTHQCTGDVAMMRAIPGMHVLYPAFNEEIPQILDWYRQQGTGPLYIRLHRTPVPGALGMPQPFQYGHGVCVRDNGSETAVLTSGPHMLQAAVAAVDASRSKPDLYAIATLKQLAPGFVAKLIERYGTFYIVEEICAAGGLHDAFSLALADLRNEGGVDAAPVVYHRAPDALTFSTLEPQGLYRHFGLDGPSLLVFLDGC
jgi:transketolase